MCRLGSKFGLFQKKHKNRPGIAKLLIFIPAIRIRQAHDFSHYLFNTNML